jgi:hypothetical protein
METNEKNATTLNKNMAEGTTVTTDSKKRDSRKNKRVTKTPPNKKKKKRLNNDDLPPRPMILEEPLQQKINEGIMMAAAKYAVKLDGRTVFYFNYHGKYHGNKKLAVKTENTYEAIFSQYWRFLGVIGDFESMLPLVSCRRLNNVPAMKVESLTAFMRYKKMVEGTILRDNDDGIEITNKLTKAVMKCTGSWKNNKSLEQFQAAISRIHKTHGHVLPYMDVCDECTEINNIQPGCGCRRHSGRYPHLFRSGNPTRTETFANIRDAVRDNSYLETGCDSMDPSHIRLLRDTLTKSESVSDLGKYALILIACRLFLRADEILKMKMEDIFPNLFIVHGERVVAMGVRFKGKTDKKWKHYWLRVDDEYPDMCPVRHLLVYFRLSGIKSGYLFPTEKEMKKAPVDGHYESEVSYTSFLYWFRALVKKSLLGKGAGMKLGLHMFRKTAYKLALWGKGDWHAIKLDARHVTDKDAQNYAGDSMSQMQQPQHYHQENNGVKEYQPSIIDNPVATAAKHWESPARRPIEEGGLTCVGDALKDFVRQTGCPLELCSDKRCLLKYAMEMKPQKHSSAILQEGLAQLEPRQRSKIEEGVRAMRMEYSRQREMDQEQLDAYRKQGQGVDEVGGNLQEPMMGQKRDLPEYGPSVVDVPVPKKRKTQVGGNDLEGRHAIRNLGTLREKVEAFIDINKDCPLHKYLTDGARKYVRRNIRPTLLCLEVHFDGNLDNFCEHWDAGFKMKFEQCCNNGDRTKKCGVD